MATLNNYFSTRIKISDLRVNAGLPASPAVIQRVGKTVVRTANTGTYPANGNGTYQVSNIRGTISVSIAPKANPADPDTYTHDARLEAPGQVIGTGIVPTGTLSYFPKDKIPFGWIELGNSFQAYPLTRQKPGDWIDEANAVPRFSDTEFKPLYDILKSWDLILSESYGGASGGIFLTKDPFKGYFVRCLNPYCEGVDANNQPLTVQTHAAPKHTHDGKSFKTMPFPHKWYYISSNSASHYQLDKMEKINHYNLLIVNPLDDIHNYGANTPIPTSMNLGDKIILTFTSDGSDNVRLFGEYGYDGGLYPTNSRNVKYYIDNVLKTESQYISQYGSGQSIKIEFYPKVIESNISVFIYRYKDKWDDAEIKKEIKVISYEDSDVTDRGRTPFWQENIPAGKERFGPFTRAGVGGSPNGINNAFDGSVTYSFGTKYIYNYKWKFDFLWDDSSDGSIPVTMDNFFTPPFRITDRKDRIHSVTDYDNHIHTRIRTMYRSVIDKNFPIRRYRWEGNYWPDSFPDRIDYIGTSRYYNTNSPTANDIIQFDGTYGVLTTPDATISTDPKWGSSKYLISRYQDRNGKKIATAGQSAYEVASHDGTPLAVAQGYDQFYKLIHQGTHPYSSWQWKNDDFYFEPSVTYITPYWSQGVGEFTAYELSEVTATTAPSRYTLYYSQSVSGNQQQRVFQNLQYNRQQRLVRRGSSDGYTKYLVRYSRFVDYGQRVGATAPVPNWRYRILGKKQVMGAEYVPYHILKSTNPPAPGYDFYNTGDDGIRTSLAGNHHHETIYEEVFYRGNAEFRPINMALVLCIKW